MTKVPYCSLIATILATCACVSTTLAGVSGATPGIYHFTGSAMNAIPSLTAPSSVASMTGLGDGTALIITTLGAGEVYYYDGANLQRGSVNLDNFDGASVAASLEDGTALLTVPAGVNTQVYWFTGSTLVRGSVDLDNFDNTITEYHPLGDGTALVKLDAANNEQIYWFNQSTLLRGVVNLDNFDGATILTDLDDGTAILGVGVQFYWFNQTTLLRGTVDLDNFDGAIDEIHPLGDGTALMKLNPANSQQIYWFNQSTLLRGVVNLDNFDGATILSSLRDGTAILGAGVQYYWFDQTTLQRGGVGLDNFDGAIDEIHPLGAGPVEAFSIATNFTADGVAANVVLNWESSPGHVYTVSSSSDLAAGAFTNLATALPATPPLNTFTDTVIQADAFYQVEQRGIGTALTKLNPANSGQIYWFNQDNMIRGGVNLDNFDGATILAGLQDGTAILQLGAEYYYFDQATLLRGTVGLDPFDNQVTEIVPLGDGTALMRVE